MKLVRQRDCRCAVVGQPCRPWHGDISPQLLVKSLTRIWGFATPARTANSLMKRDVRFLWGTNKSTVHFNY